VRPPLGEDEKVVTMRASGIGVGLLVTLSLAAGVAAAPSGYRWVDEQGNVGYAGRRDQVPERYRDQLPPEQAPPRPQLPTPARGVGAPVSGECILRVRGTERRRGSSQSFPNCEACWKALRAMGAEAADRAECVATSVESYR
jgi:hypothetical protein